MSMMEMIFAFAAGSLVGTAALIAYMHLTRERIRAGAFDFIAAGRGMERISQRLVRDSEDIGYCAVMMLTNGNGHPTLGTPLYATLIASQVDEKHDAQHRQFERLEVDGAWKDTLMRVYNNKAQALSVDVMNEGEMKDLYQREGLKYVELHFLKQTAKAGFYLAVGSYTQLHMEGARWDITSARTDIRRELDRVFK